METITKVYTVYNFDELSEEAKVKAIEWGRNCDLNFYDDWWEDDYYTEKLKEVGIEASMDDVNFSLDRSDYLYFSKISIFDEKLFLRSAGYDLRKKLVREELNDGYVSIKTRHYGGGDGKNIVEAYYLDEERLTDYLNALLSDIKSGLQKEMEYLYSDEAIIETIEANEYTFSEDGERLD